MTYIVKELSQLPSKETLQSAVEKSSYPKQRAGRDSVDSLLDDTTVIQSVLALIPSQDGSPGRWKKAKHVFGGQKAPNYYILVTQDEGGEKSKRGFFLYQGSDAAAAMGAYEKIRSVLEVLLKYGSVVLNEVLLREIVLPEPSSIKHLTFHLLEVMETMPDAHPEWHRVLQVLLHSACMKEDQAMVDLLVAKGGSLEEDPIQSTAQGQVSQETTDWLLTLASPEVYTHKEQESVEDVTLAKSKTKTLSANQIEEVFPTSEGHVSYESSPKSKARAKKTLSAHQTSDMCYESSPKSKTRVTKTLSDNQTSDMCYESSPFHLAADLDDHERLWQLCREHELISVHLRGRREAVSLATCPLPRHQVCFLPKQVSVDIQSQSGRTPLMVAIEKQYLKSTLFLLLSGADPNQFHPITEDTPLHFAVRNRNLYLVKLLLVFDADPSLCNKSRKTPIDLARALDSKMILNTLEEIYVLQQATWTYFSNNLELPPQRKDKEKFIITMDGGGVRAFNMCQAFISIENRMKQLKPSCRPFFKYFDYIAGTSSGGLLALFGGYTDAKTSASRAVTYKIVTDVFSKSKTERDRLMNQYLQEVLGEDTVMSSIPNGQRVIITTTVANTNPCQLHLMTSYGEARDGQPGPSERKVWEAGRATSAAPYFFPMFQKKYLDGGLMANNPALDTLVEVVTEEEKAGHKQPKIGLLLSLGTGYVQAKTVEKIETFMPGMSFKMFANIPDTLHGLAGLLDLLVSQVTQSDGQAVQRTRAWCKTMNTPFYRISPTLSDQIDPLSSNEKKIINMLYEAQKNILERPEEIDAIAKLILTKR